MLGFDFKASADVIHKQYRDKLDRMDKKYHDEIHLGYILVSDPQFVKSVESNLKEGWKYLDKSMKISPTIVINNYIDGADSIEIQRPHYAHRKAGKLHCYLCEKALAESVVQKIKFMEIKCNCNDMYVHSKCADNFIMKYSMCDVCKKYYDITPHCSSLRDIL